MKFDLINWFLNWRLGSFEYLSIQFFLNCLVEFLLCLVISMFWWRLLLLGFLLLFWRRRRLGACRLPLPLTCAGVGEVGGLSLGSLPTIGLMLRSALAAGECGS
jgi:hypothetical protein